MPCYPRVFLFPKDITAPCLSLLLVANALQKQKVRDEHKCHGNDTESAKPTSGDSDNTVASFVGIHSDWNSAVSRSGQGPDGAPAANPDGLAGGFPGLSANAGVTRQQSRDAIHPQVGEEVSGDHPGAKFVAIRISHCAAKRN